MQDCHAQLLTDLNNFIRRFVSLSAAQADICALWVVHTHALDAADFTPYLDINSPVLRSGKTRLLEVLRLLGCKPWFTGRVTASALVRKIDNVCPTLLLDETDVALQTRGEYSEVLRGILNTGFERDGRYSMSVPIGSSWEPRDFQTFSPKAFAGIGHLPATIRDRSLTIGLRRAKRADKVQRFRKRRVKPEGDQLRQRIEAWAKINIEKLREAQPDLPDELNDRQQDVCEPLLALADLAGDCWPARARTALIELCTGFAPPDDSTGQRVLADIKDAFTEMQTARLSTRQLLQVLHARQDSPWGEFEHGRPLSPFQLSRLLTPFDVRPRDIRFDQAIQKGYLRADFEDPWDRYLPPGPEKGQKGQQASVYAGSGDFSEGQQQVPVADAESMNSPVNMRVVADVAPSAPPWAEMGEGSSFLKATHESNGKRHCQIHPANRTDWWLRGGIDPVCGVCHPHPN
jgi:hypothetical protein